MKVTGNIKTTFILILAFATACGNGAFAQTRDYVRDIQALEYRISKLEKALNEVSTCVTKEAKDTLTFYQEAEKVMRKSSLSIDSLKRRISELERKQADVQELRRRIDRLEAKVLELERRGIVAKEREAGTNLSAGRNLPWRVRRWTGKQVVAKERRADASPLATSDSNRWQVRKMTGEEWIPSVVRHDYEYRSQPHPRDTVYISAFDAYPEEVRTAARYRTVEYMPQGKSGGRAISAALGLLGWWIAMFCLNSWR